ncbi:MAG TPA: SUF system NifU family Fe-S cluster assembly protein [Acetobacteraceae bacterium]|nr:SUF system NifU family Fe-S cluster assembly protein [Acetobacteraceae bacterium]
MFDDLADLYQEVILEHSQRPRHGRKLECFDATARGDNPMCGDRVQLFVRHGPDGTIEEAGFEARGCAISVASADMMAEVLRGRTDEEARQIAEKFRELARTGALPEAEDAVEAALETLQPLAGVHAYPSRVKCATLAWHALIAALAGGKEASSE